MIFASNSSLTSLNGHRDTSSILAAKPKNSSTGSQLVDLLIGYQVLSPAWVRDTPRFLASMLKTLSIGSLLIGCSCEDYRSNPVIYIRVARVPGFPLDLFLHVMGFLAGKHRLFQGGPSNTANSRPGKAALSIFHAESHEGSAAVGSRTGNNGKMRLSAVAVSEIHLVFEVDHGGGVMRDICYRRITITSNTPIQDCAARPGEPQLCMTKYLEESTGVTAADKVVLRMDWPV